MHSYRIDIAVESVLGKRIDAATAAAAPATVPLAGVATAAHAVALPVPLTQVPWPFAPILLPSTIPRLSSSIINPPSTGVAIGGVAIGGAPSAVALGAEPPPEKRRHGERGPDGRPRAARRCKECKKQGRTDQQQPTWCSGRLANKGETPFFFLRARRRRPKGGD